MIREGGSLTARRPGILLQKSRVLSLLFSTKSSTVDILSLW